MKSLLFLILLIITAQTPSYSQGCSDAGFCSVGNLKSNSHNARHNHAISIAQSVGVGERKTRIFQTDVELRVAVLNSTQVEFKLPFLLIDGDLASTSGIGDPILSVSQDIFADDAFGLRVTLGVKFHVNSANATADNRSLPMVYQTSLGTNDLIAGLSGSFKDWSIALGYQHPYGANGNAFLRDAWSGNENAQKYFESNELHRMGDVLLRIEKVLSIDAWRFNASLLPIFHIANDSFTNTDANVSEIDGSKGLTLNLNLGAHIDISESVSVALAMGFPLIIRNARPDGLTRSFAIKGGIAFSI